MPVWVRGFFEQLPPNLHSLKQLVQGTAAGIDLPQPIGPTTFALWLHKLCPDADLADCAAALLTRNNQNSLVDKCFVQLREKCFPAMRGFNQRVQSKMNQLWGGAKAGAYLQEDDYYREDWSEAHWGENYAGLQRVKHIVDPGGLFWCYHCVGSDKWSSDGQCRALK